MYVTALLSITFVILMGFTVWTNADVIEYNFKYVRRVNEEVLHKGKMAPEITLVYYYKSAIPRLKQFFAEYEKAGAALNLYKIKLAMFDCTQDSMPECEEEDSEKRVYAYKNGHKVLDMAIDTVFDVHSLVASTLQLELLEEVPIIQTVEDFNQLRDSYRGAKSIVFSFQIALGTFEHRVFMEVAYAYRESFKFAITTENEVISKIFNNFVPKNERVAVWVLSCKETDNTTEDCKVTRFTETMKLEVFAVFLKRFLLFPSKFDIPGDGLNAPYEKEDVDILYLYYNKDCEEDVKKKSDFLARELKSRIGIITVNTDEVDVKAAHKYDGTTPSAGVKSKAEIFPTYMLSDFTLKNIVDFTLNTLKKYMKIKDTSAMEKGEKPPKVDVEEVETQDDQVAEAAFRISGSGLPIKKKLCELNDKTFKERIAWNQLTFVVFFYPSCGKSRALLWAYRESADQLEDKDSLCVVNCYDWTDVCTKENITAFPTMNYYRNGRRKAYERALDTSTIVASFKLLSVPNPLELSSEETAYKFMSGEEQTRTLEASRVIIMGLFSDEHNKESEVFKKVADDLHGKVEMGIFKSKESHKVAKKYDTTVPAVIIVKPDDVDEPFFARSFDFSPETLQKFIQEKRFHVVPELSALMFPVLLSRGSPFVILFTSDNEDAEKDKTLFSEVAMSFESRNVTFCYMPLTKNHAVNHVIKAAYGGAQGTPAVAFVNHSEGLVYNFESEFNEKNLLDWLEKALLGDLRPSSILPKGEWKPKVNSYNFLEMMDYEKRTGRLMFEEDFPSEEEVQLNEDLGVGFDSDGNYLGIEEDYVPPKKDDEDEIKEPESERWKSAKTRHQNMKEKQEMANNLHKHTEL